MHERTFRHLLIPTDGSDASVAAARLGFRLARVFQARIDVLCVVGETVVEFAPCPVMVIKEDLATQR